MVVESRRIAAQSAQDALFGVGVDAGQGVVEDQDGRAAHQGARDGRALFLSAGQRYAAFARPWFEALRKFLELLPDVGGFRGFEQFFGAGVGRAEGEVLADCLAEEEGLLRHHADVAAQRGQRIVADGPAVDQQRAFGGLVEAGDQIDQGGLAAAGGPDDGEARAGGNVQIRCRAARAFRRS